MGNTKNIFKKTNLFRFSVKHEISYDIRFNKGKTVYHDIHCSLLFDVLPPTDLLFGSCIFGLLWLEQIPWVLQTKLRCRFDWKVKLLLKVPPSSKAAIALNKSRLQPTCVLSRSFATKNKQRSILKDILF
jgi:hypothetical protein